MISLLQLPLLHTPSLSHTHALTDTDRQVCNVHRNNARNQFGVARTRMTPCDWITSQALLPVETDLPALSICSLHVALHLRGEP